MDWLEKLILNAQAALTEEAEGYLLGRGLTGAQIEQMRLGLFMGLPEPSPDPEFRKKNGDRGQFRTNRLLIPYLSPRGLAVGAEFRYWGDQEKHTRDYRSPTANRVPVYIGLTQYAMERIWGGADVVLVEGIFDLVVGRAIDAVPLACGTAQMSRRQADFLVRFLASNAWVHVCFDMDGPGRRGMNGGPDDSGKHIPGVVDRLRRAGIKVRPVAYRGGKDPGEIWDKGGLAALRSAFY